MNTGTLIDALILSWNWPRWDDLDGLAVMKNTITGLMAAVVGLAVVAGTLAILGLRTKQYASQPFNILRQVKRNHR